MATPLVVPATGKQSAALIFLHGLGANSKAVEHVATTCAARLPHVKFILPQAPNRSVTMRNGAVIPAWFNLESPERFKAGDLDLEGVQASVDHVAALVEQEVATGLPAERIVIGGFSQGGVITAAYSLAAKRPPPAAVVCSGWLLKYAEQVPPENQAVRFLQLHGEADEGVVPDMAVKTEALLKSKGVNTSLRVLPGVGHEMAPPMVDGLAAFLADVIPA